MCFKPQPYTIFHLENTSSLFKLWWQLGFWSLYEAMCLQNMGDSKLYLQQCQPGCDTLTRSCSKWHVQHLVTLGFLFWTKPRNNVKILASMDQHNFTRWSVCLLGLRHNVLPQLSGHNAFHIVDLTLKTPVRINQPENNK